MTRTIGLAPSECWSKGDEVVREAHVFKRREAAWKLDSGLNDTDPLGEHVGALLRMLSPYHDGLLEAAEATLQTVCVGHHCRSFSRQMDFRHQQAATALHIGFWFDTCGHGGHHEEIVDLPRAARHPTRAPRSLSRRASSSGRLQGSSPAIPSLVFRSRLCGSRTKPCRNAQRRAGSPYLTFT